MVADMEWSMKQFFIISASEESNEIVFSKNNVGNAEYDLAINKI